VFHPESHVGVYHAVMTVKTRALFAGCWLVLCGFAFVQQKQPAMQSKKDPI
jgi:hypothetical protein